MATSDDVVARAVVGSLVDELYPPVIRDALLSDKVFRDRFGFQVDVQMMFEGTGIKVSRAALFSAIREAVNRNPGPLTIQDAGGLNWTVEVSDPLSATIRLKQANRSLSLPAFWMLIDDPELRLSNLDRTASELNLPGEMVRNWKQRLTLKPLSDEEVDGLFTDLKHLPLHVMSRISAEIVDGASSFESLAPRSSTYFTRLAGQVDQASSLETFVKIHARKHFQQLIEWNPQQGLGLALLLSWHSSIAAAIEVGNISDGDLEGAFEEVCEKGDVVSQVGAIELGLSVLDRRPALATPVEQMIRQLRDDDPESLKSRFRLLSALGVLVEGEISRTGVLRGNPPFWRRLAAFAQASLVERCMRSVPVDIGRFSDLANSGRGELFYLQNLCDLRLEPKWLPDFIAPDQLKAEFLGRIANAAKRSA
ncbi:hypothetical protein DRY87_23960, partial [Salmonella enterica subsp. enterica serovar Newport]|nr:hypothetical protein [Salmonella enterica subsp. enterica serovar Newport]